MKSLSILCVSALLAASAGLAKADTISLASYGSTASAPAGTGNSATVLFNGFLAPAGATYDIPTGGIWHAPIGDSSWVSQNSGNYPGGSNVEPNGVYTYYSTFTDNNAADSSGSITVLADDSTSVLLNGHLITLPASSQYPAGNCTQGTPNCLNPATYTLTGFVNGTNYLTFNVTQDFGSAEGLDYAGSVSVTPEPSSLLLMATGLLGMGAFLYRRQAII